MVIMQKDYVRPGSGRRTISKLGALIDHHKRGRRGGVETDEFVEYVMREKLKCVHLSSQQVYSLLCIAPSIVKRHKEADRQTLSPISAST